MRKPLKVLLQYIVPQHGITSVAGWLGKNRWPWLKNWLIQRFIRKIDVKMQEALIENPCAYPDFNAFFTRRLKPELRPIVQDPQQVACPVDGCISQIGKIDRNLLMQAKGCYFDLQSLLGGSAHLAQVFDDGQFATIYLAPKDYHRVHMPLDGRLLETIFIPGKLFSVNQLTAQNVPNLFARNERLVCIFETPMGSMAVILVGAMMVGSIGTTWKPKHYSPTIATESFAGSIQLPRGAELGYFEMGSTVIVLFAKNKIAWSPEMQPETTTRMGQLLATQVID